MRITSTIGPTNARDRVGRREGRLRRPSRQRLVLALGVRFGRLLALFLRHLLVLGGAILRVRLPFLGNSLATQRGVAGRLLAAAEQLVKKSHVPSCLDKCRKYP